MEEHLEGTHDTLSYLVSMKDDIFLLFSKPCNLSVLINVVIAIIHKLQRFKGELFSIFTILTADITDTFIKN